MSGHSIGRAVTILVSAALLATLVVISTTAPASAGKPRCFGRTATIVGTAKADVIKGTAKADVIVARGGHDTIIGGGGNDVICGNKGNDKLVGGPGSDLVLGGTGHDKLHGQTGPDRLLGGPGDDAFDGGAGVDLCAQGTGIGPRANCERPPLTVAPPPPAPAPPAPPPKVLAIAYSDLNGTDGYQEGAGDVLISKLVDTNPDGMPSKDDTIIMGKYPTTADPKSQTDFADWGETLHGVGSGDIEIWDSGGRVTYLEVRTMIGDWISWRHDDVASAYQEDGTYAHMSEVQDLFLAPNNRVTMNGGDGISPSPSHPGHTFEDYAPSSGDDPLIDVEFYFSP